MNTLLRLLLKLVLVLIVLTIGLVMYQRSEERLERYYHNNPSRDGFRP